MFVKSCNHKKVLLEIDVAKNGQNSRKILLKEFVILCNYKLEANKCSKNELLYSNILMIFTELQFSFLRIS